MAQVPSAAPRSFGTVQNRPATVYRLENDHLRVCVTDYGGILVSVEAPDRSGRKDHVLLGFENAEAYARAGGSFGAIIGRCANRIASGQFVIDGVSYQASRNDRGSTLHGGQVGFGSRFWSASQQGDALELSLVSADGDQGFPGQVSVSATYHLSDNELRLDFVATTTEATPVTLSTHPYFNLAGSEAGDCLAHLVTLASSEFLETDADQIPTGKRLSVSGTPFDFRKPQAIGERIRDRDVQLEFGSGYDHYFVLSEKSSLGVPCLAARISDPSSGRVLEILTTQPGLQFYSGNQLTGSVPGRSQLYRQSAGFAIEPHGFPNAVNQPNFPSVLLRPNEIYRETTIYRFSVSP